MPLPGDLCGPNEEFFGTDSDSEVIDAAPPGRIGPDGDVAAVAIDPWPLSVDDEVADKDAVDKEFAE